MKKQPKTPKPVEAWALTFPNGSTMIEYVVKPPPDTVSIYRVRIVPIVKRTKRKERKK